MSNDVPRFCPFCRECFEGVDKCPDHELPLVALEQLPPDPQERHVPREDEPFGPLEWRYGRGAVLFGAVLAGLGFFLPVITFAADERFTSASGFEFAASRAPALWTIPFAALVLVGILLRRTTPRALSGARLVAPFVAVLPLLSVVYVGMRVSRYAALAAEAWETTTRPGFGWGAYVVAAGSLVMVVGSFRLGAMPRVRGVPHGAAPEGETGVVVGKDDERDDPR